VFLAFCVLLALLQTIDFSSRGGINAIGTLARSGMLGAATILGWFLILIAGPFSSVQLWRLRRIGLYATATLAGFFLVYYFAGLLYLRAHNAQLKPILAYVVFNGALVVLLTSSAARRSCT